MLVSFRREVLGSVAGLCLGVSLCQVAGSALADSVSSAHVRNPNVFEEFIDNSVERAFTRPILQLFAQRRYADAERSLRRLIQEYPRSALHRYNLAAALARQGKKEEALDSLDQAIEFGFSDRAIIARDDDLQSIRDLPRYAALLAKVSSHARRQEAAPGQRTVLANVVDRRARVETSNTSLDHRNNVLVSRFAFAPSPSGSLVHSGKEPIAQLLNEWFRKGQAAGNHGDLYDNRDRDHSRLSRDVLKQISHIDYGADAVEAGLDYGVNSGLLFNAITFGNSSTALTHSMAWRSQARLVQTTPDLIKRTYLQYLNNHLYVYPEHQDHDSGRGDLLPANTPYMLISQGSSGSDQPFLYAIGATLAAFRPDVKRLLRRKRLVVPTIQLVLRRGQEFVKTDADYLSGRAHPSVFVAEDIDLMKIVELANALKAGSVPPRVKLSVLEEDQSQAGTDYFAPAAINESLFDTPGAIARIVRSPRYWRRIVVTAAQTVDPNGRALNFRWSVLRGDASRIRIRQMGKSGERAEILVPWHERQPIRDRPEIKTDRVDIGVFADNGENISAPAFVTFLFPGDQKRTYDENGKVRCIDYNDKEYRKRYVDPLIFLARDWRDCYEYDQKGNLIGWNRIRGNKLQRFTRDGAKVIETDEQGRPTLGELVRYDVEPPKNERPKIVQVPVGQYVRYVYRGLEDRYGVAQPFKK